MIVYVESNFILEIAFRQEQAASCRSLVAVCAAGGASLVVPAFSIAEPFHTYVARAKERSRVGEGLRMQLGELARSETFGDEAEALQRVTGLLVRSAEEERSGLQRAMQEILGVAELIPLDGRIIAEANDLERTLKLSPQDAIVLASVLSHLNATRPEKSCFMNRNTKDFDDPDVIARLTAFACKLLPRFDDGLGYVQSSGHAGDS